MGFTSSGETATNGYDYDTAIRGRFKPLEDISTAQTNYVAEAAQRRMEMKRQQDEEKLASVQANIRTENAKNTTSIQNGAPQAGGAKGSLQSFMNAIGGQESGSNYGARNKDSGAMGKYQVMPGNIIGKGMGWDKEALGYDISTSQFMASPQIQEQIAQFKMKQYYNRYGPAGGAVAWYAGPGMVGKYGGRSQGQYPTINAYSNSILRKMGL